MIVNYVMKEERDILKWRKYRRKCERNYEKGGERRKYERKKLYEHNWRKKRMRKRNECNERRESIRGEMNSQGR